MGPDDRQIQRTARANVRRWFTETPLGHAFLPGDGSALPISAAEAIAIPAEAESTVAGMLRQVHRQAKLHLVSVAFIFAAMMMWSGSLPPLWHGIVKAGAFGLYAVHGLSVAYAFWRCERSIFALRGAIAHSMRGRVPLPAPVAGPMAAWEPDYRMLGTVAFGLLAVMVLAETAPGWLSALSLGHAAVEASHTIHIGAVIAIVALMLYMVGLTALRSLTGAAAKRNSRR